MKKFLPVATLFFVSLFLLLTRLGTFPFKDYDEATYALVAAEMADSGEMIFLTHNGLPWLDKPPLLFWMMMPVITLFGFSEFALRIPGALMGLGTIFLTYAFAKALTKNQRIALLAAAILAVTSQFVYSAREVRLDVPAAFGILLAVYGFYRGWQNRRWYLCMGFGIAATILFKSTFVVFIPMICLLFAAFFRQWFWLKEPLFWLGGLSGFGLAAPWHILQWQAFGDQFVSSYLARNSYARYLDPILGARNAGPLYFFIMAGKIVEPWFLLFFSALAWLCAFGKRIRDFQTTKTAWALASTVGAVVLLLSFSQSKLFSYFDPIYPFVAIFLAIVVVLWHAHYPAQQKKIRFGIIACLVLGFFNTLWQIAEIRGWPRKEIGEYAVAKDEEAIARALTRQTSSAKLYTLFHDSWDTIRFYSRDRREPIEIRVLEKNVDPEVFFLLIPNHILEIIDVSPAILERSSIFYQGEALTLYLIDKKDHI